MSDEERAQDFLSGPVRVSAVADLAALIRDVRREEREGCVALLDEVSHDYENKARLLGGAGSAMNAHYRNGAWIAGMYAAAIRARGDDDG